MKSYIITKKDSGYTLLFAVLIASLVLGVATFILGVAHKQYVLSSTARNSSYAFYAADSGIECMSKDYGTPDLYGTSTFSFNCAGQSPSFNFGGTQTPVWDSSHSTIIGYSWFATSTLGFATSTTAFNAGSTWGCAIVSINQYYSYNIHRFGRQ